MLGYYLFISSNYILAIKKGLLNVPQSGVLTADDFNDNIYFWVIQDLLGVKSEKMRVYLH